MIPYGRQWIDEDDIEAVVEVLRSDWLTTGPNVDRFERAVAAYVGAGHGAAVSSGTAALHGAMYACGIGPGDEVIVPAMTFAATANCVAYQGGTPVFADVLADSLLIDPESAAEKITDRTRAIIAVDFAGHPCDYDRLRSLAEMHGIRLVSDACHALGAAYRQKPVGCLSDLTVFSFHPVKHITTGEGGMVVTDDEHLVERIRRFRNHGITSDFREREKKASWFYEMADLGYNYRITDIQCALGLRQLDKLPAFLSKRRAIAAVYDRAFEPNPFIEPLQSSPEVRHAYHLYVVRIPGAGAENRRDRVFRELRRQGIGANVHYIPVHLHPFYRKRFNTHPGLCPVAESAYEQILSLPMHPGLSEQDLTHVISALTEAVEQATTS